MSAIEPVIYLVDDDASFLSATSRLLRAHGHSVRSFASPGEFLKAFEPGTHGCIIADLDMPQMNGLELQEALTRAGQAMPMVFLSGHGDIKSSVLAMRHGAEDFVTKRAPKRALLDAIDRALSRDTRARAEQARLRELRTPFEALTPRDREVLGHVLDGHLNKQIATALGIDERSVKRHRSSIMSKLRVESVAELTRLVDAAGLTFEIPSPTLPTAAPPPAAPPRP